MPRFYFDLIDGTGMHRDEVGLDLPDLDAATQEARRALVEMIGDAISDGDPNELRMRIRDAGGESLTTVSISAPGPERVDKAD